MTAWTSGAYLMPRSSLTIDEKTAGSNTQEPTVFFFYHLVKKEAGSTNQ